MKKQKKMDFLDFRVALLRQKLSVKGFCREVSKTYGYNPDSINTYIFRIFNKTSPCKSEMGRNIAKEMQKYMPEATA